MKIKTARLLESAASPAQFPEMHLPEVAFAGRSNVGKSSLLNHLAKRDVVIVHDRAGTTRDVVEIQLDLGGFPVFVSDTAGIRESSDEVESEGIRRAKAVAEESDLVVGVCDASVVPALDPETLSLLGSQDS